MTQLSELYISAREQKKLEITSIARQTFDLFDNASANAILEFNSKFKTKDTQASELSKNLTEVQTNEGSNTFSELAILTLDKYWIRKHIIALYEMKIIYLFKSLEIKIKSLIHAAYPDINTADFYKLETMMSFFKSLPIQIHIIPGYNDVHDLNKVNNCIKHSGTINEKVSKIKEFVNETQFNEENLDKFQNRIKTNIENFSNLLGQEIIKDLFTFDENRINDISKNFKLQMDTEILNKLANKLTEE